MTERTILDLYRNDVDRPRSDHYSHFTPHGRRTISTEDFFEKTAALAESLVDIGVSPGDRVMLLSDNQPEWHMVDLAVLSIGAVDVPVYGTLTAEQIAYQAQDSGAIVAVVDTHEQMAKYMSVRAQCPHLKHLIQIEGEREHGVESLEALMASSRGQAANDRFWDRAAKIDEHSLMTLIYTSGTTGDPKGVMLSHSNLVQNVLNSAHRVPVQTKDLVLEFLPLCHVLERMVGYIYMWRATSKAYCSVYHVGDLLTTIKPTLFVGVPRFYEKVQQKILDQVSKASPLRRSLFKWAMEVGTAAARRRISGQQLGAALDVRHKIADRLVLSKVRAALGGRLNYCLSGGAELPLYVNEFFHSLGITLIEGYGLTETSPVIAVNGVTPETLRLGTVGKPLKNLEVKLAEDGELLVRGPSVMKGYWNKEEQTAEVFDQDGFFATGDIAEIDDDGFLLIVDRKKDIIVTAGGKNVAPQPIEGQIKQSAYVDTAVLIGDRRPFIVALISPAFEELEKWAKQHTIDHSDRLKLVTHPQVVELYAAVVNGVNASLARYERVKKFKVLPLTLSIEDGQLTPTLKVKRRVIEQQMTDEIESLFTD